MGRVAALTAFFFIAVIVVVSTVNRLRAGQPASTLFPESSTSNASFIVRDAGKGSPLHKGDLVAVDDPVTLAMLQYGDFTAGGTVICAGFHRRPRRRSTSRSYRTRSQTRASRSSSCS